MPRLFTTIFLLFFLSPLSGQLALAASPDRIVVLDFGGKHGPAIRAQLIGQLQKRYDVLPGDNLVSACDQLGLKVSRGANLARCATTLGAMAVVGGAASKGTLTLAVYSAETGQPVKAGKIAFGKTFSLESQRNAMGLLNAGLRLVARGRKKDAPAIRPREPDNQDDNQGDNQDDNQNDKEASTSKLEFDPDEVNQASPNKNRDFDPMGDDPLTDRRTPTTKSSAANVEGEDPAKPASPNPSATTTPAGPIDAHAEPKVSLTFGLGTWLRSLQFTDYVSPSGSGAQPSYSSGGTFALRFALWLRPISFFSDGFAKNFFVRLRSQFVVGLSSLDPASGSTLKTSLWEFLGDLGYRWNILDKAKGPILDFSFGYGASDFSIDWAGASQGLPNTAYRFLLAGLGVRYAFVGWLGAECRFDYRPVLSSGQIEDDLAWFGPASVGGIALSLAIHGRYKGFIANLEYTYSRYFYAFSETQARYAANRLHVAAGALDELHGILLNVGYAY